MRLPLCIILILNRINDLPESSARRHLRALRYSLSGNGATPPDVYSPEYIAGETGLRLDTLFEAGILLGKNQAVEVLPQLGIPVKPAAFRKRTKEQVFRESFGESLRVVGQKLVFTYLEIMIVERQFEDFPIPANTEELLKFVDSQKD